MKKSASIEDPIPKDLFDILEDLILAPAQRDLIGDLIEMSAGFGALAIQSPHRQVDLADRLKHFFDVPGEH